MIFLNATLRRGVLFLDAFGHFWTRTTFLKHPVLKQPMILSHVSCAGSFARRLCCWYRRKTLWRPTSVVCGAWASARLKSKALGGIL